MLVMQESVSLIRPTPVISVLLKVCTQCTISKHIVNTSRPIRTLTLVLQFSPIANHKVYFLFEDQIIDDGIYETGIKHKHGHWTSMGQSNDIIMLYQQTLFLKTFPIFYHPRLEGH